MTIASAAQGCDVLGIPVVGPCDRLFSDVSDSLADSLVIAVGSIIPRESLYKKFVDYPLRFPSIISSRATVSASAVIGKANIILPHVYIGPRVVIGDNNYITTSTTINHDTSIGSHCYFSTSVSVAGRVTIGNRVRFDSACCITADACVEDDSLVGPATVFGPMRGG